MTIIIVAFACIAIVSLAFAWLSNAHSVACESFERSFPGRCAVCSIHAYGIQHGHEKHGTIPRDHRCIERWDRWKGALHPKRDRSVQDRLET